MTLYDVVCMQTCANIVSILTVAVMIYACTYTAMYLLSAHIDRKPTEKQDKAKHMSNFDKEKNPSTETENEG